MQHLIAIKTVQKLFLNQLGVNRVKYRRSRFYGAQCTYTEWAKKTDHV